MIMQTHIWRSSLFLLLLIPSLQASAQLEGMLDVHVHSDPDSMARSISAIDTAREARDAGMRALVFKNHYTETVSTAYLVSQVVPDIALYGGIALNRSVGGLNPAAIDNMARISGGQGRIVWMPTYDSEYYHINVSPNPLYVPISSNGQLLPEVAPVLEMIKQHDLALATGHSSPEESILLIKAAKAAGIDRIVVTHATMRLIGMSLALQQEAASLGAKLEFSFGFALRSDNALREFVDQIRAIGPEHVILSSDLGQPGNLSHTAGLRRFLDLARAAGLDDNALDVMLKENPAWLLGLE
jgi:Family of unknown function (DUF6282)